MNLKNHHFQTMQAVRDFLLTDALEMKFFLKFPEHMAAIQRAVSASDFGQVVQEVEELQHAYVLKHHVHKIRKADPWMVMTFGFGTALYTLESSWVRVAVLVVTAVAASAGIIWDQKVDQVKEDYERLVALRQSLGVALRRPGH